MPTLIPFRPPGLDKEILVFSWYKIRWAIGSAQEWNYLNFNA